MQASASTGGFWRLVVLKVLVWLDELVMFIWILIYWTALAKAQQLLLNDQERDYILTQVQAAKGTSTPTSGDTYHVHTTTHYARSFLVYLFFFFYSFSSWQPSFLQLWNAEELKMKRKKQLKKNTASKIKSLVDEVTKPFLFGFTFNILSLNLFTFLFFQCEDLDII